MAGVLRCVLPRGQVCAETSLKVPQHSTQHIAAITIISENCQSRMVLMAKLLTYSSSEYWQGMHRDDGKVVNLGGKFLVKFGWKGEGK